MSLSNILEPNNLNLFCGSINSVIPPPIIGKLTVTNNSASGAENIYVNQTNLATIANDITFASNGFPIFSVGENPTNTDSYCYAAHDFKIGTNFTERLRILQAGIPNDNTITNIIGLQGTVLSYKNNLIDTTTVNQPLLTTSSPTFGGLTLMIGGREILTQYGSTGSIGASTTVTLINAVVPLNQTIAVSLVLVAQCIAGANTGYGDYIYDFKAINNGGVLFSSNGINQQKSEANITGIFVGAVSITILNAGIFLLVNMTNNLLTGDITFGGTINVYSF